MELTDPPVVALALLEFPWTTIGPYNEAMQFLICTHRGRPVRYVPHIFVTSDVAMAGGREAYGYPKKMAHIDFVQENEIRACYVERPRGLRICSGLIRPERPLDPSSAPMLPAVCLRAMPGPEGPLLELIETGSAFRAKELWSATGSCHLTGASELDPWHRLPVRQLIASNYMVADFELTEPSFLERL